VRQAPVEIAGRYFAPAEVCDLVHAPLCQQQHRFFEYWTLKESYIKARGMGLSIPLDKFSFHCLDERAVRLTTDPTVDDNANRWRFWQCRPTHDHLLAICADVGERAAPQVTIRKLVPPVAHTVLDLEFLKTSE
jgi:4'-phosphopantetheinyl transferase